MISCVLPRDYFAAGKTALCLLKGAGVGTRFAKSTVSAQVHGHISADFRWLRSSKKLEEFFQDPPTSSIEQTHRTVADPIPLATNHASYCIFSTSRIAISPSHIAEGGAFLEFEIPADALPSHKGLCATTTYYVTIFVQYPTHTETIDFPIIVRGSGASTVPYQITHSSMVAYPASSLPVETLLSAPTAAGAAYEHSGNGSREVPNIYMIRDNDHICDLHLASKYAVVGNSVMISLDFSDCVQTCSAVRASVVLSERRPCDSRVEDKVVNTCIRTATDAEYLRMIIHIPEEMPCSFESPLFKVVYRIELDFCLPDRSVDKNIDGVEGIFDRALSFSIPVEILHHQEYSDVVHGSRGEASSSGNGAQGRKAVTPSSSLAIQQLALRCLESNIVSLPLRP